MRTGGSCASVRTLLDCVAASQSPPGIMLQVHEYAALHVQTMQCSPEEPTRSKTTACCLATKVQATPLSALTARGAQARAAGSSKQRRSLQCQLVLVSLTASCMIMHVQRGQCSPCKPTRSRTMARCVPTKAQATPLSALTARGAWARAAGSSKQRTPSDCHFMVASRGAVWRASMPRDQSTAVVVARLLCLEELCCTACTRTVYANSHQGMFASPDKRGHSQQGLLTILPVSPVHGKCLTTSAEACRVKTIHRVTPRIAL
jgi:hypothetical protein